MLLLGRSRLVFLFPSPSVPESILWWLYRVHQLQLGSHSLSLLFTPFQVFHHKHEPMVSHWSLSDSKFPQVSRTLPNILADFNKAGVSTCPLISLSSNPCIYPLVTVPSAPITIGFTFTFMFHSFFNDSFESFSHHRLLTIFHWSPIDLKSPELFLVFWPISTMLSFGWSSLILLFPSPPVPVSILWWMYRACQLQLGSQSLLLLS